MYSIVLKYRMEEVAQIISRYYVCVIWITAKLKLLCGHKTLLVLSSSLWRNFKARQLFIKRLVQLQRLWRTLFFNQTKCFKYASHIVLMFNAHMAMQPDHTKLWSYKGKHLALPFPVPSPPMQGVTQLLQSCLTPYMWQVGKRDREDGVPGCAVAAVVAWGKRTLRWG